MKFWTDIREWYAEEDSLIRQGYDSITLYTGDEGDGKSLTMLARHKTSDASFNADRIHFDQEPFMEDCVNLSPGQAVQLDEFDGHKRLAMHGVRKDFLKFLKERRSLRLRMGIGFPHIDQMDKDILRSRVRYWGEIPQRGLLIVHRRSARTVARPGEDPYKVVSWPIAGRFVIPKPTGPLVKQYDAKKDTFTHRDPGTKKKEGFGFLQDPMAAASVISEIRASLKP